MTCCVQIAVHNALIEGSAATGSVQTISTIKALWFTTNVSTMLSTMPVDLWLSTTAATMIPRASRTIQHISEKNTYFKPLALYFSHKGTGINEKNNKSPETDNQKYAPSGNGHFLLLCIIILALLIFEFK